MTKTKQLKKISQYRKMLKRQQQREKIKQAKANKFKNYNFKKIELAGAGYDFDFDSVETFKIIPNEYQCSDKVKEVLTKANLPLYLSIYKVTVPAGLEKHLDNLFKYYRANNPKNLTYCEQQWETLREDVILVFSGILNAHDSITNISKFSYITSYHLSNSNRVGMVLDILRTEYPIESPEFTSMVLQLEKSWRQILDQEGKFEPRLNPNEFKINSFLLNQPRIDITEKLSKNALRRFYKNVNHFVEARINFIVPELERRCFNDYEFISPENMYRILSQDFETLKIIDKKLDETNSRELKIQEYVVCYTHVLENMKNTFQISCYTRDFTRHYNPWTALPKAIRYVLERINSLIQIDLESCHPNILLSSVTGSCNINTVVKLKQIHQALVEVALLNTTSDTQTTSSNINSYNSNIMDERFETIVKFFEKVEEFKKVYNSTDEEIASLIEISGKFRQNVQKLLQLEGYSEEEFKIYFLKLINQQNRDMIKGISRKIIDDFCANIKGGDIFFLFIAFIKQDSHLDMYKSMFAIESLLMETVLLKCHMNGINGVMIHDCISVKQEDFTLASEILHDTMLEFGILQESTKFLL